MVLGHLAAGSLGQQCLFRRAGLAFCLIMALGPDWIDKPLKLLFGLPGHGIAHSLLGGALFLLAFRWACRRFSLPECWPRVAVFFWGLHFLCDLVKPQALLWPLLGPFPTYAATTAESVRQFYAARPLSSLAAWDLFLALAAVAARLPGLATRWARRRATASTGREEPGSPRRIVDTTP